MLKDLLARRPVRDAALTDSQRAQLVAWRKQRLAVLLRGPGPDSWALTRAGRVELSSHPDKCPQKCPLTPRPPEQWDF